VPSSVGIVSFQAARAADGERLIDAMAQAPELT
jgi:hypothetical protein